MSEACPGVGDEAEPGQAAGPSNLKDWLTGAGFRFFWPLVQRGLYALLWALSRPQQLELRFFLAFSGLYLLVAAVYFARPSHRPYPRPLGGPVYVLESTLQVYLGLFTWRRRLVQGLFMLGLGLAGLLYHWYLALAGARPGEIRAPAEEGE